MWRSSKSYKGTRFSEVATTSSRHTFDLEMETAYFDQKSWILTKYFDELSLHQTSTSTSDCKNPIHIPDCKILNSKNMTTLETNWGKNFPKSKRNYIIGQIVKSVIPEPNAEALNDKRIKDLISHARLVEKKFFDMAHDRVLERKYSNVVKLFCKVDAQWRCIYISFHRNARPIVMSLADLPDVLIAQLTSYLDYSDICNLMETSKKNYNAIKSYKKDKLNIDTLYLYGFLDSLYIGGKSNTRSYVFNKCKEDATLADNLEKTLNQCTSVAQLLFVKNDLTSDVFKILMETKVKIGNITMLEGYMDLPAKDFVALCQKYRNSNFKPSSFNPEIWTDDVLIKLFEASTNIESKVTFGEMRQSVDTVTDLTLKALMEGNMLSKGFRFNQLHNSFTVDEIVKFLEAVRTGDYKNQVYMLGVLQSNQMQDAVRYFHDNRDELNELCKVQIFPVLHLNRLKFKIKICEHELDKDEEDLDNCSVVVFEVLLP